MTEKKGHFEKEVWVLDSETVQPRANGDAIDKRFSEATKAVISSSIR